MHAINVIFVNIMMHSVQLLRLQHTLTMSWLHAEPVAKLRLDLLIRFEIQCTCGLWANFGNLKHMRKAK